ncbi:hypothetical protein [Frankia sp. Cr1]|uniref:hypothetical protein n=1 Tax=Frankia sp. Cr1 TaxID=3073931 RepID=UPI002AD24433|nr:hypothetical protein [Frankia sp. Cr1]
MAGPRRFRALSLAALSVLVPLAGAALALPASAAPSGPPRTPDCAWRVEASPQTVNAGLLDSDAVYWVMPFAVQKDLNIVLSGTYADARYTSLTVYDSSFAPFTTSNGVSSELTDYHIAPDAGSLNPWQVPASPGGHFNADSPSRRSPGADQRPPSCP